MDSSGDDPTAATLAWLLACDEPAVRYLTRRELVGDRDGAGASADAAQVLEGPRARALLAGQQPDGGFGVHPYRKWTGAHWRLVLLVQLAVVHCEASHRSGPPAATVVVVTGGWARAGARPAAGGGHQTNQQATNREIPPQRLIGSRRARQS